MQCRYTQWYDGSAIPSILVHRYGVVRYSSVVTAPSVWKIFERVTKMRSFVGYLRILERVYITKKLQYVVVLDLLRMGGADEMRMVVLAIAHGTALRFLYAGWGGGHLDCVLARRLKTNSLLDVVLVPSGM